MQTVDPSYAAKNAQSAKDPDFILAISGWPTLYSVVKGDYTIPSTGDLSTTNGFSKIYPWMNIPNGAAAKVKGRPEEGGMTLGQLDISVVDRRVNGIRALTDLVSRQAYLDGTAVGTSTTLASSSVSPSSTTLTLTDATNFANGSLLYISQECILLNGKSGNTFTSCTRGYLLTDPAPHSGGVKTYGFLPSLYARRAYLYRGYRSLTLDKWARTGGGAITSDLKEGTLVKLEILSQTWDLYHRVCSPWTAGLTPPPKKGTMTSDTLKQDYSSVQVNVSSIGNLQNGHYFAIVEGEVAGIRG